MKTKLFTLLSLLLCLCSSGVWASTVDNLATISSDYTFIADNFNSTGTSALTTGTLYDNNRILSIGGNNAATNKNSSTISGVSHYNSLRLKNSQNQLAIKVSGACSIKFYTYSDSKRGVTVGTTPRTGNKGDNTDSNCNEYGQQTVSTTTWTANITSGGVVYIASFGGDFWIAGFEVTFPVSGNPPTINTQPVGATYEVGATATALSVSATAYASGALSYQWYSNTTQSTDGATAIDGATSSTYAPSTSSKGTTYYYCIVTEAGNEDTARTNIVAVTVQQHYTVSYAAGESGAAITFPTNIIYEEGTVITLPTNHYFYKANYSLSKWNDGSKNYSPGESYTVEDDVTFYPVFVSDKRALGEEATTITWTFARANGAPNYSIEGDGQTTTVIGTTAHGKDLAMGVALSANPNDGTKYGKFSNTSNTDYAQVNSTTAFTIPAVKGMTVTYKINNGSANVDHNVLFGNNHATSASGSNYVYEYTGADGSLTIYDKQGDLYPSEISVSYPYTGATLPAGVTSVETAVKTISKSVSSTISSNTWSDGGYSFGGGDLKWSDTNFKVGYPKTLTIAVPSNVKVTKIQINGQSESSSGSNVTVGTTTYQYSNSATSHDYTISNPRNGGSVTITNGNKNFLISSIVIYAETGITLTTSTNMAGWRAFYDASNGFTYDANTTAYIVKAKSASTVSLTKIDDIPAGTPVILHTTSSDDSYKMTLTKAATTSGDATGNLLEVTTAAQDLSAGVYRLGYGAAGVGLYPWSTSSAAAGIVYISIEADARVLNFVFDDEETTGISDATRLNDNGQLINDGYFDLQGRKVAQPTKGLYIVNGRKVVIK
jgi:hypothetical protein